jgi:hypothetical protein
LKKVKEFLNSWWVPIAVICIAVLPSIFGAISAGGSGGGAGGRGSSPFSLGGGGDAQVQSQSPEEAGIDPQLAAANSFSERMQVTVQLAVAGSLVLSKERAQGRIPADAPSLYANVLRAGIAPKYLSKPQRGSGSGGVVITYDGGEYLFRYAPGRFLVEVVSTGRYGGQGDPAIIVRTPGDGAQPDMPSYYKLVSQGPAGVAGPKAPVAAIAPPQFQDGVSLIAIGWRASELPFDVLNKTGITR